MVDKILQYVLGVPGLLFLVLGYFSNYRRWSWWTAAICALSAAAAAHYDTFWALATFSLGMVWALVCTLPQMDFGWRLKTGFVAAIGLGAFLCVWPTLEGVTDGKLHCPAYVKDNVPFRVVAGLDLRGGLRLVYTVDVEEAIKDKRDRYYDEMRQMLATSYELHKGDKPPTREELSGLEQKVVLEKPRDNVSVINIRFIDPNDENKIDEACLKRFQSKMAIQRNKKAVATFKI